MFQSNKRIDKKINKTKQQQNPLQQLHSLSLFTHTLHTNIIGKYPIIRKNSINAVRNKLDVKGMLCHESLDLNISCLYLKNVIIQNVSFCVTNKRPSVPSCGFVFLVKQVTLGNFKYAQQKQQALNNPELKYNIETGREGRKRDWGGQRERDFQFCYFSIT